MFDEDKLEAAFDRIFREIQSHAVGQILNLKPAIVIPHMICIFSSTETENAKEVTFLLPGEKSSAEYIYRMSYDYHKATGKYPMIAVFIAAGYGKTEAIEGNLMDVMNISERLRKMEEGLDKSFPGQLIITGMTFNFVKREALYDLDRDVNKHIVTVMQRNIGQEAEVDAENALLTVFFKGAFDASNNLQPER